MFLRHFAQQRVNRRDRIDLVAPELDPIRFVLIAGIDFNDITAHAETASFEIDIVAFVLQFNQSLQQSIARDAHAGFEKYKHPIIGIRIAETINARNTGDDDYIAPLK